MFVAKFYCCRTKVRTTFTHLRLWFASVLASPAPPGFNVACDLPPICCGHFADKSSHRLGHNFANIEFWGAGGIGENKFVIFNEIHACLVAFLFWWCELLSDICLNEASCWTFIFVGSPVSLNGLSFVYTSCLRVCGNGRRSHVGSVAAITRWSGQSWIPKRTFFCI